MWKWANGETDVILSLTRTRSIGYLRSIRRLTVALSRARLGLYILGRRSVFESCFELKPAFDILFAKPDVLQIATGEMYGSSTRKVDEVLEEGRAADMEGVEHLGKYVYEMTKAKVEAMKAGGGALTDGEKMDGVEGPAGEDEDVPEKIEDILVASEEMEDLGPAEPEEMPIR